MEAVEARDRRSRRRRKRSGTRWPSPPGSARTPRSSCSPPARCAPASAAASSRRPTSRSRLVFWWSAPTARRPRASSSSSSEVEGGTRVRVTESRPLAMLTLRRRDSRRARRRRRHRAGGVAGAAGCADGRSRPGGRRLRRARGRHAPRPVRTARQRGEASATELARELPVTARPCRSTSACSQAPASSRRAAPGREVLYHPTPAPMSEAMAWMAEVGAPVGRPARRTRAAARPWASEPLSWAQAMSALLVGFGLGFFVGAQPGPVSLLCIRSVLRGAFSGRPRDRGGRGA